MSSNFEQECDRLSRVVDPDAFDQAAWADNEGQILEDVTTKIKDAFKHRKDLHIIDQAGPARQKKLLLSNAVEDGTDIAHICVNVSNNLPVIWASAIDGGAFRIVGNKHYHPEAAPVTEEWIEGTLSQILSTIQR